MTPLLRGVPNVSDPIQIQREYERRLFAYSFELANSGNAHGAAKSRLSAPRTRHRLVTMEEVLTLLLTPPRDEDEEIF